MVLDCKLLLWWLPNGDFLLPLLLLPLLIGFFSYKKELCLLLHLFIHIVMDSWILRKVCILQCTILFLFPHISTPSSLRKAFSCITTTLLLLTGGTLHINTYSCLMGSSSNILSAPIVFFTVCVFWSRIQGLCVVWLPEIYLIISTLT